jgi:hypothetical protein
MPAGFAVVPAPSDVTPRSVAAPSVSATCLIPLISVTNTRPFSLPLAMQACAPGSCGLPPVGATVFGAKGA